ncbi:MULTISPECIES: hypothetical protein [Sphingobium]|jgi:hypothetical protein|uniref:Uncharacterized protein n=1 Tax=Sphingobium lactosutens DS20 TaxID=1331060 RepID=T0ISQ8_9SPHN|nr:MULTISPECIES: hypothetical protein [Sphingobium]EQB14840.1 hypothetical protein RLDS_11775 [Sphingobium lactosutens DS20]MDV3482046.1 hypothetical protein [Sphingobium yanoikuyae]HUD94284.1 hypothetical protein [Sphingobium sp.]
MKSKSRHPADKPDISPAADAAIIRLARLLGRQMARELHEEHIAKETQAPEEPH